MVAKLEQDTYDDVDSSEAAVEVVLMWGADSVLHVDHLAPPRAYAIGQATDAKGKLATDFLVGRESLGVDRLPILAASSTGTQLVIPHGATGEVTLGAQVQSFEALAAAGALRAASELEGARCYALAPGATARVAYRGFVFLVRPVAAAKRVGVGGLPSLRWRQQVWTLISLLWHAVFLLMFYLAPPRAASLSLDPTGTETRLVKYLVERNEQTFDDAWLEPPSADASRGEGQAHARDPGRMGEQSAPRTRHRYGVPGPRENPDPHLPREQARELAATAGILGVLKASAGAWNVPTSPYGRDSALGRDPEAAVGALDGERIGAGWGIGGLTSIGSGRGGGGTGEGSVGSGVLGTLGGRGGDPGGYGTSVASLKRRVAKLPQLRIQPVEVHGALAKETIRRVIRRHLNEVRHCYEQALRAQPLEGRVAVKLIIDPTGGVQAAAVEHSTLAHAGVEACITATVRRWVFPAPEGGGIVVVSYPFVFQHT